MNLLWSRYYKVNRMFLLPLGIWPYGNRKLKPIQTIFCTFILLSHVITQLIKIFTTEYNLDFVLTNLSFTIPAMIYTLKYNTFYIQAKRLKKLFKLIHEDWNSLTSEEEIHIIRKYTIIGRRYTVGLATLLSSATICYILYQFVPNFLDFITPLNESRPRQHPFMAEYFIDEQKYFNIILMHMIIAIIIGVSTFIGTETIFLAFLHHMCGMFKIVSYRIKHALDENVTQSSTAEWNICVRARLIGAVEIHQRAITFFNYFNTTLYVSNFILLCLGIASLSVNLFRAAILPVSREDTGLLVLFVFCHFYYMFLGNYTGQKVIDQSMNIFHETNNVRWYNIPVQSQKLLLFIMQRSMKNCKLLLGGVYYISLEGFTTMSSMSMSYFTVLCSTR